MKTVIFLFDEALIAEAKETEMLPNGWYSQCQEGDHEDKHIVLRLEETDADAGYYYLPPFTYWHEGECIDFETTVLL